MRALITGAPGWLGNRFLEILAKGFEGEGPKPWDLRCLVAPGVNLSFINNLSKHTPIECVTGDITRRATLDAAVRGVDVVFHIAGIIHTPHIKTLYAVNAVGTENMVDASVRAKVKKFVHISSNSVAGTNRSPDQLLDETMPDNPYMHYGLSKQRAEKAVKAANAAGRMQTVILRPCWYYGPNQPPRQTTFFKMIKKGNPIIFGNGKNLRSMSYVDNTCQALILAAEKDAANGQTYWIADERPYTSDEIYRTVADLLEVKSYRPRHIPNLVSEGFLTADKILQGLGVYIKEVHVAGEMNKSIACSIEKARRELGYNPMISLYEGMRRSIAWCRANGLAI